MGKMGVVIFAVAFAFAFADVASAFQIGINDAPTRRLSPLFMGRAAAVRAATKSKTDAKKAKVNAVFGKRLIMAVKQGGGPDPEGNRMLADVIKQAKANNVPVDVSRLSRGIAGFVMAIAAKSMRPKLCVLFFVEHKSSHQESVGGCNWRLL